MLTRNKLTVPQRRVITPLTVRRHAINPGGVCHLSRDEGDIREKDRRDAVDGTAVIASSGEPDPLGVETTRMRSTPMAGHAAPQTTA
jgi:hypothetical protein